MFSLLLYNLTGGRINRSKSDDPVDILLLSTTGRKTGKKRSNSLVYIRYGSSYIVSASNAGHELIGFQSASLADSPASVTQ